MCKKLDFIPLASPLPYEPLEAYPVSLEEIKKISSLGRGKISLYMDLLNHRYITGHNLPNDEQEIFRLINIKAKKYKETTKLLIKKYFILHENCFVNYEQEKSILRGHRFKKNQKPMSDDKKTPGITVGEVMDREPLKRYL